MTLVSCLCPTYGRARALGEVLECFLLQDYPERELIILNDAPTHYREIDDPRVRLVGREGAESEWAAGPARIRIVNEDRFATLGHKYNRLLDLARGPLVAHWEDDDIYLPWHLSSLVGALEPGIDLVKSDWAWVVEWTDCDHWWLAGMHPNAYEAQMLFRAGAGREIGYSHSPREQSLTLLKALDATGRSLRVDLRPCHSYAFRWGRQVHGEVVMADGWWHGLNVDFAEVLAARDVSGYFRMIAATAASPKCRGQILTEPERVVLSERVESALEAALARGSLLKREVA